LHGEEAVALHVAVPSVARSWPFGLIAALTVAGQCGNVFREAGYGRAVQRADVLSTSRGGGPQVFGEVPNLVHCFDERPEVIEEVQGADVEFVQTDVRFEGEVEALVEATIARSAESI
jgi:hypothetical protein